MSRRWLLVTVTVGVLAMVVVRWLFLGSDTAEAPQVITSSYDERLGGVTEPSNCWKWSDFFEEWQWDCD
jgi:hypothetical protein